MNNLKIMEELNIEIHTKEWRYNTLIRVTQYREQFPDYKILKKIEKLVENYELSKARAVIKQEILYENGTEKRSKLKSVAKYLNKLIDEFFDDTYSNDSFFILSEPEYKLTDDEFEEIKYKIDHMEEIQKYHETKKTRWFKIEN